MYQIQLEGICCGFTALLEKMDYIDRVEFDYYRKINYTPNDPRYNQQWFLEEINSNDAWELWDINNNEIPGNRDIILASIDLGVNWQHEDLVNNPDHYNQGEIECIDAIEAMLSKREFIGYLRGNSLKYRWRFPYKDGVQDLDKAMWYENRLHKILRD